MADSEGKRSKVRITKRVVDGAKTDKRESLIWDSDLAGFGLRVTGNGAKAYILQYRHGGRGAVARRMTIGTHGSPWTAETARQEARRLLALIEQGHDPLQQRQDQRDAMTIAELCDVYVSEGSGHKKPSTLAADLGRINAHIKPLLGKKRLDKLTRADVEKMLSDVKAGKPAVTTPKDEKRPRGRQAIGGAGVGGQCVMLLSAMLSYAVSRGWRADNPAAGVKKPPIKKMERFLSQQEITRLAEAINAEAARNGNPYPGAAIKLLMLTGCRRSEVLTLEWSHVDIERACLFLPDSKTGAKTVYLNAPALALLQSLPRLEGNPHVFPGDRQGAEYKTIDKVWYRVRDVAGLPGLRLHDLRHTFASIGAIGGLGLPVIGAMLGHHDTATTARYAHLSADPIRAANEAIGARINAAMTPKPDEAGAEVVQLPIGKRNV